jgi:hypothetical protein
MFERASKKLGLEQAVLGTRQFNDNTMDDIEAHNKNNLKIDPKEMEQLLREVVNLVQFSRHSSC